MARLTKSHQFDIYEDSAVETTEINNDKGNDDNSRKSTSSVKEPEQIYEAALIDDDELNEDAVGEEPHQDAEDADDERRISTLTSTSVSSFPDSYYLTENDDGAPPEQTYTPPIIRPRFRRPESVRRMQMSSPPPYGYRSPRQSALSNSRSRTGTPRSARSVIVRRRPGPNTRPADEDGDAEGRHYPLVLLHVSLIPINIPWSLESMRELLSPAVLENLLLLKSKLSETVLQRGLLIPHPREEYELLEERLLEALELKDEKITKCGHFRNRGSDTSTASTTDSGRDSDSGIGSSEDEVCATCRKYIKSQKYGMGSGSKKWMIKVFAANGLMRSSAWTAAWADMERVDVEILPWISDDVRQKLDERKLEEEKEKRERQQHDESRIRDMVEEQVRMTLEESLPSEPRQRNDYSTEAQHLQVVGPVSKAITPERLPIPQDTESTTAPTAQEDLPQIYRPSQIPLSILLKNYILLLARDRRNVVIFLLSVVVLMFAVIQASTKGTAAALGPVNAQLGGRSTLDDVILNVAAEERNNHLNALKSQPTPEPEKFTTTDDADNKLLRKTESIVTEQATVASSSDNTEGTDMDFEMQDEIHVDV